MKNSIIIALGNFMDESGQLNKETCSRLDLAIDVFYKNKHALIITSGWDYDAEDGTGRLVFEIDNNCIPDNTTQRVRTFWGNTQLEVDEEAPLAQKFEVYGNYPNPFNPSTQIKFATEKSSDVTITIYSILGQEMTVLQNGILNAGTYNISWFGTDHYGNKVPSGVYFYEVRSDNRIQKGKMLLLK